MSIASWSRHRSVWLVASFALAWSSVLAGSSVTLAAQSKIEVCHYDRSAGMYSIIKVSATSAHLDKSDFLPGALDGLTVFARAYSETDGTTGFSACDVLISAMVDGNGNSTPDAGDTVLLSRYPQGVVTTKGFGSFPASLAVTSVPICGGGDLKASFDTADNAFALFENFGNRIQYLLEYSGGSVFMIDWVAFASNDFVNIFLYDRPSVLASRASTDNPFLEVDILTCNT